MKISKHIILVLVVASISSCTNSNHTHQNAADPGHKEIIQNLHYNNGNPWLADAATYSGMQNIKLTLSRFSAEKENPSITDYHALGKSLSAVSATIIKECTMEGEPHDQLHAILKPMLDNIGVLSKTKQVDEAKEAYQVMSQLSETFDNYFQQETK